jgi:hypothetical protein
MKVNWKGHYSYEQEFDERQAHSFELLVDISDDEFEGIAVEEEFTARTNESPIVIGFVADDRISFTKQYPFQFAADDDNNIVIDRSKPGHQVVYEGVKNHDTNEWEGHWEIMSGEVRLSTDVYLAVIDSGSWRMKIPE